MSATHANTCINILRNTRGLPLGKHVREQHGKDPSDTILHLRSYRSARANSTAYFIKQLKPTLNKQSDSTLAKLFL